MAYDATADATILAEPVFKYRQEERVAESLAAEEAAGRRLALRGRTIALLVVGASFLLLSPFPEVLFYELLIALFIVAGYGRHAVERFGLFRWWQPYAQIALDSALLAIALVVPNPIAEVDLPIQVELRFGNFVYYYVLLGGLAFGYQPRLLIWGGITGAVAWGTAVAWISVLPNTILTMPEGASADAIMSRAALPTFVDLGLPIRDIVVFLIVATLLAAVVARSRAMVERQAALERERGNLARYFPPATVDRLAKQDTALAGVREQEAAVLFADLVGFTHWAERHSPHEVIALLREVHGRLEDEVFRYGGTLDKFIGDGLMATFGTPDPGPRDATNALSCLKAIVDDYAAWNHRRSKRGKAPIQISVGLHYGPVVVGNIGTDRRLELAVLGDTVNVAARIEALTRELHCVALVSTAAAEAAMREEPTDAGAILASFVERGAVALKGRERPVAVLAYGPPPIRA
jgi:adenylate cyclase